MLYCKGCAFCIIAKDRLHEWLTMVTGSYIKRVMSLTRPCGLFDELVSNEMFH